MPLTNHPVLIYCFTLPFTVEGFGNKQLIPKRKAHDYTLTFQSQALSLEDSNLMPIIGLYYILVENYKIKLTNSSSSFTMAALGQVERFKIFLIKMNLVQLTLNIPKQYAVEENAKVT